jgi:hypothetical protein
MSVTSKLKSLPQKTHEMYLRRRSQRIALLKKAIEQLQLVEEAEKFFDTLEVYGTFGHEYIVSDDLHALAHWVIDEEEGKLDDAIHCLVVADKGVRDAANATRAACAEHPAEAAEFKRALPDSGALMNWRGLSARRSIPPALPPSTAKVAHVGKYNYGQVRDIIRNVAMNPRLGRQSAYRILQQAGRGALNVSNLKPENLDNVYDACRVLLTRKGPCGR